MTSPRTLLSFETPHPPDSLSVLPSTASSCSILACGTYRLMESTPQRRIGTILLYGVEEHGPNLQELTRYEGAGILDLEWCRTVAGSNPILVVADAEGCIGLYCYGPSERRLYPLSKICCSASSALALSLSLQPSSEHPVSRVVPPILASLSTGELAHVIPTPSDLALGSVWQAHEHEAWVVSWGKGDNVAYSGSDDLTFKGWDLRLGTDTPTFVTRRFEAGITSIQPSPWDEHHIAVGSYDSLLRIYDTRSPQRSLYTHSVSGGAWRLAYHPEPRRKDEILVASMHGGAEVVHVGEGEEEQQWARFEGHDSMCYGAEWLTTGRGRSEDLIASCSFYDQKMCLWKG